MGDDTKYSLLTNKTEIDKYSKINYFSIDYYLPDNMTCIEVDSDYHINRRILDEARDIYLESTYYTKTIRFYHFDQNKDKENLLLLDNRIRAVNINPTNVFNYSDIIYRDYLYENNNLLIIFGRMMEFVGFKDFFTNDTIYLTEKDYNDLAFNLDFGIGVRPMLLYQDFINLAKSISDKNIIIYKNIKNYSIKDINYIFSSKVILNDIISKYKGIPYWIAKIINIPDNYKKFIYYKNWEDDLILKYVNEKLPSEKGLNS